MTAAPDLEQALTDLVRGDGVRRASHTLEVDGRDVSALFFRILDAEGFCEIRIDDIEIEPGERVPAFYVDGLKAHFGWVFWEVFSESRRRKLFGSQVKNEKGDWAIILGRGARVHACLRRKEPMDVHRPSNL